MTLLVLATFLVVFATAAKPVPRHAFPRTERVSGDLEAQVAYWHGKAAFRLRLASRYERQRNHLRDQLRRRFSGYGVAYAIHLASTVYGVSEYQMHRVASCESGHNPLATNGQYRGVFQEGPMFEAGPFGRAGFSVFDPIANVMTAAYTVSRQGWRQWQCQP